MQTGRRRVNSFLQSDDGPSHLIVSSTRTRYNPVTKPVPRRYFYPIAYNPDLFKPRHGSVYLRATINKTSAARIIKLYRRFFLSIYVSLSLFSPGFDENISTQNGIFHLLTVPNIMISIPVDRIYDTMGVTDWKQSTRRSTQRLWFGVRPRRRMEFNMQKRNSSLKAVFQNQANVKYDIFRFYFIFLSIFS